MRISTLKERDTVAFCALRSVQHHPTEGYGADNGNVEAPKEFVDGADSLFKIRVKTL